MDVLEERFGDVQIHIDSHYTAMTHLPPATDKPASLRKLLDEIERNLRSLEALKQDVEHPLFIPMITANLPQAVMVQLELARGSDSWTVASLRKALGILVRVKETSERQCHDANKGHQQHPAPSHVISTGVSLLQHHEKRRPPKCFYCSGAHFSDECEQYRDLDARKAHSKLNDRCSICFRSDHIARDCKQARPCFHCKLSTHHRSLCDKKFGGASVAQSEQKPENSTTLNVDATPFLSATQTLTSTCEHVIMQTALATIQDESGQSLQARLLFDTGSSRTYITESIRKSLDMPTIGTDVTAMANFGASQRTTQSLPQVEFHVQLLDGSAQSVQASVVPQICCPILKTPLDTQTHPSLERLPLAEPLTLTREHVEIDILVGTDFYYDFVLTDRTHFPDGLILLDTKLGFICTGKVPHSEIQPDESTVMVHDVPNPQCTRSDFLDKPPSELHGSPSSFLGEDPVRLTTPTPDEFEECVAEDDTLITDIQSECASFGIDTTAVVNTRPLVAHADEFWGVGGPLTPAQSLSLHCNLMFPIFLILMYMMTQNVLYLALIIICKPGQQCLTSLRERPHSAPAKRSKNVEPRVNSIVLIKESSMPRGTWRLGRVVDIHDSQDGWVRSATVQLASQKQATPRCCSEMPDYGRRLRDDDAL
eukprot:scpid37562/ scgid14717/ 